MAAWVQDPKGGNERVLKGPTWGISVTEQLLYVRNQHQPEIIWCRTTIQNHESGKQRREQRIDSLLAGNKEKKDRPDIAEGLLLFI